MTGECQSNVLIFNDLFFINVLIVFWVASQEFGTRKGVNMCVVTNENLVIFCRPEI